MCIWLHDKTLRKSQRTSLLYSIHDQNSNRRFSAMRLQAALKKNQELRSDTLLSFSNQSQNLLRSVLFFIFLKFQSFVFFFSARNLLIYYIQVKLIYSQESAMNANSRTSDGTSKAWQKLCQALRHMWRSEFYTKWRKLGVPRLFFTEIVYLVLIHLLKNHEKLLHFLLSCFSFILHNL